MPEAAPAAGPSPAPAPERPGAGEAAPWPGQPAPPAPAAGPRTLPDWLEPASYGSRVWAAAVDAIVRIVIVIVPVVGGAIADAVLGTSDVFLVIGLAAGLLVSFLGYAPFLLGTRNGQTWGHQAAGIRVVHRSGAPLGVGRAFVREVLCKAVLIEWIGGTLVLPMLVNYLWPLWDDRSEALHDKMCDTAVVRA